MYILTRYVVWEVFKFFFAALTVLTLIVTVGMGFQKGMKMGLPPLVMMRTMPFMLPEILGITMPAAMLYAVSSVYGRMTGANEIVAIKSSGINPMAVVWPVLVLAALLSLGTVCMNEIAATWCRPTVHHIAYESIEDVAYGKLQKDGSYDCEKFSITVKRVDGRRLIQPVIILKGKPDNPQMMLTATEATLRTDWENGKLLLICREADVEIEGKMQASFPDIKEFALPINIPPIDRYHRDLVSTGSIPRLKKELKAQQERAEKELEQLKAIHAGNKALGEQESQDADAAIKAKEKQIADFRFRILRLEAEPARRWSNGFTCLCFALIGTPVAMLRKNADALTNFFLCFLPILAIYYPLLMFSEDLSTSGTWPPISFWTGNVVLAIPAIYLLRRMIKH